MVIYIDSDSNRFINDPSFKSTVVDYEFKRGDKTKIELCFVSGNAISENVAGRQFLFGFKAKGKFDADYVVFASDYTVDGDKYVFFPDFNTVELNDILNSGDDEGTNDLASVILMFEISWSDDGGDSWTSTNALDVVVFNDVNKGVEGSPLPSQTMIEWLGSNVVENLEFIAPNQITITGPSTPSVSGVLYKIPETLAQYSSNGSGSFPSSGNWSQIAFDAIESAHRLDLVVDGSTVATWYGGGSDSSVVGDGSFFASYGTSDDVLVMKTYIDSSAKFVTNGTDLHVNIGTVLEPIWKRILLD